MTEAKFRKLFESLTTVRPPVKELQFYFHSPIRLCVSWAGTLTPEAWFKNGGPNLKLMEFKDVKDLANQLRSWGAREVKKPKPHRVPVPIYD